jgi:hypothetical protein
MLIHSNAALKIEGVQSIPKGTQWVLPILAKMGILIFDFGIVVDSMISL